MTTQLRTDPLTGLRVRVAADAPPAPEALRDLYGAAADETVTEALEHPPLAELDAAGTTAALTAWRSALRAYADAPYALVSAAAADPGATLHALAFVPAAVARERERFAAHATRTMGGDLLAELVQEEVRRRERLVAYDDECVVLAAFAPRVPYELVVVPRSPVARFTDDGPLGAHALHDALGRLQRALGAAATPTVWVRSAPQGADRFCWRLDVLPPARPDALELATGVATTPISPERAAAELRAA